MRQIKAFEQKFMPVDITAEIASASGYLALLQAARNGVNGLHGTAIHDKKDIYKGILRIPAQEGLVIHPNDVMLRRDVKALVEYHTAHPYLDKLVSELYALVPDDRLRALIHSAIRD